MIIFDVLNETRVVKLSRVMAVGRQVAEKQNYNFSF